MRALSRICLVGSLTIALMLTAACGGGDAQPTALPTDAPPTHTPFPTFAFVEPTKAPEFEQTGADSGSSQTSGDEESVELDAKKVERGLGRYEALECGACHGEAGKGSDEAGDLLAFAMSEDAFITFMRTGGELGTDHQYSTDRLSDNGSRNLYQYLLSLARSG